MATKLSPAEIQYLRVYNAMVATLNDLETRSWKNAEEFWADYDYLAKQHNLQFLQQDAERPTTDDERRAAALMRRINDHIAQVKFDPTTDNVGVFAKGEQQFLAPITSEEFLAISPTNPIAPELSQLVADGILTNDQLGDLILANNYIVSRLNALPAEGGAVPILLQWLKANDFRLALDEPAKSIIYTHLTNASFKATYEGFIPEDLPMMEYPSNYTAPTALDDVTFNTAVSRLNASAAPAKPTMQPIAPDLSKLVADGILTTDQLGDLILCYNKIIQDKQLLRLDNDDGRAGKWNAIDAKFALFIERCKMFRKAPNALIVPLHNAVTRHESIPAPMDYPSDYAAPKVLDDAAFDDAIGRLMPSQSPAEIRGNRGAGVTSHQDWAAGKGVQGQGKPAENLDKGLKQLFAELGIPSTKVYQVDPSLPPPQTFSEKGRDELKTDLHKRIVKELEAATGTLSKSDKKEISVMIHSASGTQNTVSIVLSNAAKRNKPQMATAFRALLGKLEDYAASPEASEGVFTITEKGNWAPEPVVNVRALLTGTAAAKSSQPAADICPITFKARMFTGLLDALNEALERRQ